MHPHMPAYQGFDAYSGAGGYAGEVAVPMWGQFAVTFKLTD